MMKDVMVCPACVLLGNLFLDIDTYVQNLHNTSLSEGILGFRTLSLTKMVPVLAQSAEFRLCESVYNFYIHTEEVCFLRTRTRLSWHACVQLQDTWHLHTQSNRQENSFTRYSIFDLFIESCHACLTPMSWTQTHQTFRTTN